VGKIVVATATLPVGVVGKAYSASLQVLGGNGALHWSISSGLLPKGLTLDAGTGDISGVPKSSGRSTFVVQVADSSKPRETAGRKLSLAVT